MGFDFEKKKPKKDAAPKPELTKDQREYRERNENEQKRYKMAVDSGFWICFCFHTAAERDSFAGMVPVDSDGYCYGDELRPVLESMIGISRRRQFKPAPTIGRRMPDPFAGMEPTDDLEADCLAEADALLAAFEAVDEDPGRCDCVWDSPYHIVAIFRDASDTERFIADFGMAKYGDLYMDGSKLLGAIRAAKS